MDEGTIGVPHQVAPWLGRFVNREKELKDLAALLDRDEERCGPRVGVLTGLPGVGKSALARKAVERCQGKFAGGELLVEFGGGPGGLSVSDALASCLFALGVSGSVLPASEQDRVGLFRTRTAAKPVLIVLDDVVEPAQVTPLVPSAPGSVVLVTSTSRLTELQLDGASLMDVVPLDEVAGAHLLRELCGARLNTDPSELRELVAVCDGLPVALRAAAGRLIRRRGLSVAELVADIRAERDATTSSTEAAVFSLIYHQLHDDVASMYRTLAILPGTSVGVVLAAAAHDVSEQTAVRLLEELVEVGLLNDTVDGRFAMHDIVRRHAARQALADNTDAERNSVLWRYLTTLLRVAGFADRAVLGVGRYRCTPHDVLLAGWDDPFAEQDALRWLDAERGSLAAAVRVAATHEWHDLAWQLAESATALYVSRRYLLDWIETSELGARSAELAGNAAAEARLRSFITRPLTDLGELDRARHELDRAFALAGPLPDKRLAASIQEMAGRLHDASGEPAAAAVAYGRAVELFDSVADARGSAFVRMFAGAAQLRAGDLQTAFSTLSAALEAVRHTGNQRMIGRTMISLAQACRALGDANGARSWFEQAIVVLRDSGEAFYEAQSQQLLAELFEADGDGASARECLRRARDLHIALGSGDVDALERRLVALGAT